MAIDFNKTQFVDTPEGLKVYTRNRAYLLLRHGKPERLITWEDWLRIERDTGRANLKECGLSLTTVWTLKEKPLGQ